MATNTTTCPATPILALSKELVDGVDKSPSNTCFAGKFGNLQGFVTLLAIDLDVYSGEGSISREKVISIFEELVAQVKKQG